MYVVTVRFAIKPEFADAFLRAVQSNARTSLEREPGCHRFDVATGDAVHSDVFLYEVYTDRAAFEKVFTRADVTAHTAAMFEDDPRNLLAPFEMGLRTVHVGPTRPDAAHIQHHTKDLNGFLKQLTAYI